MIINQILSGVWIAVLCLGLFIYIRAAPRTWNSNSIFKSFRFTHMIVGIVLFVFASIGIAASVLLSLGVVWARWIIGCLAFLQVYVSILKFAFRDPTNIFEKITLRISLITLVIVIGWAVNIFRF